MIQSATTRPIRVLVVDDSAFMRTALSRMITSESGLEVAATACSGAEALEKIAALNPDVITLDVEMPGLDGLQTLHRIMARFPRPVIMVSSVTEKDADNTFTALAAGAFDYVPKSLSSSSSRSPTFGRISSQKFALPPSPASCVPTASWGRNRRSPFPGKTPKPFPRSSRRSSPWESPPAARKRCRRFCRSFPPTFLSPFSSCSTCPLASPRPSPNA